MSVGTVLKKVDWQSTVTVIYYLLLIYILVASLASNTTPPEMWGNRCMMRVCYALARWFGALGMQAELAYWKAAEIARGGV